MSSILTTPPVAGRAVRGRSIGVKLIVVCGLALAMTVPAAFLGGLVEERTNRSAEVVRQISGYSGGQQTFLGPTLVVPYKGRSPASSSSRDVYIVFPAEGSAVLKTVTEERRRSLFKVPVFRADLAFDATFDLTAEPSAIPPGVELDWERGELVVGATYLRGAVDDARITADGKLAVLAPSSTLPELGIGTDQKGRRALKLLGTRIDATAIRGSRFHVTSNMKFSGAQRVAVLSYGKTTRLAAQGDWPNPGFDGGFLPARRSISRNGYTAEWFIPFIARAVRSEGPADSIAGLETTALGTSFIQVADPYQSVNRCLKYVLLFVGLIFLSYFAMEVATAKRVHPAQYILVGIAQIILPAVAVAGGKGRLRLGIPDCGRSDCGPTCRKRGRRVCEPGTGAPRIRYFQSCMS